MDQTHLIKPIESLHSLELDLNGEKGSNRNKSDNLIINAKTDFEALVVWLRRYDDSPQTFRSYRKEIERLYLWSLKQKNKPFSSLDSEDIQSYLKFIKNPSPKKIWCGRRKARSHQDWKPFENPLSESSQKQTLTIISTCFTFLVDAGYLSVNPVKLLSKSSKPKPYQSDTVERYLDRAIWQQFWYHLINEKTETIKEQQNYERNVFIFSLLYLQSPRAIEVVSHTMQSINKVHNQWWWKVTGKGRKTKQIPWKDEMMKALCRYRLFRGLSEYPSIHDNAPLVASLTGERAISRDMLYKIVKNKVLFISYKISSSNAEQAHKLSQASTHWFRHTSLTHQAEDGVELRYLQAMARHESLETTQKYFHIESLDFHNAINKK